RTRLNKKTGASAPVFLSCRLDGRLFSCADGAGAGRRGAFALEAMPAERQQQLLPVTVQWIIGFVTQAGFLRHIAVAREVEGAEQVVPDHDDGEVLRLVVARGMMPAMYLVGADQVVQPAVFQVHVQVGYGT